MVLTISKAFKTSDGVSGTMATDIQIDFLVDLIANVNLGENSYAFLMDNRGNIITHRNDEFKPNEGEYVDVKNILDGELMNLIEEDGLKLLS